MKTTIKCKHCGHEIEVTEALRQQIEEQVLSSERIKHQRELEEAEKRSAEVARKKTEADLEGRIQRQADEAKAEKERSKKLQGQLLDLTKELRKARREKEDAKLEMQKELAKEEEKIRGNVRERVEEEHRLKDLEKDKKLQDALKANEELHRKLEQGSQQTQGEVLELDLEDLLRRSFPRDDVDEIEKGTRGADVRQIVLSPSGFKCGVVLWESKRQKRWHDGWISKLKDDLRNEGANICVIVSEVLPDEAKSGIGEKDGVWVCLPRFVVPLAQLLRTRLLEIAYQKAASANRTEKSEQIYSFVTGHEFRQQVEAVIEVYKDAREQVDKERQAFEKQWKQREAQLERLLLSTASIYGKMQGIAGSAMPQIKDLEILELTDGKK